MRKKINHPNLIWVIAIVSLGLNLLVLFSARHILAQSGTSLDGLNNNIETKIIEPTRVPTPTLVPTTAPTTVPTVAPVSRTTDNTTTATTSTVSNTTAGESRDLTPQFSFDLSSGTKIQGDTKISGKVENASAVEFYLIKRGSISPEYYVGAAKKSSGTQWEANLSSKQFPNGDYELFAKIRNVYGSYKSNKVSVSISNGTSLSSAVTTNISSTALTNQVENNSSPIDLNSAVTTSAAGDTTPAATKQLNAIYEKEKAINGDTSLTSEEKMAKLEELEKQKEELKKEFVSRQEAERIFAKDASQMTAEEKEKLIKIKQQFKEDSDGDGLPDFEEERIGTDIFSADTDQDGYLDGDEVAKGFDPLKASQGNENDRIVFEEPKYAGEINLVYQVSSVAFETRTEVVGENGTVEKSGIVLGGKALPNSFVTLYVYSSGPIVVTVQANEDGSWEYFLDKELEDGEHQVYAAVTDNTGKITSKSEVFSFIKTAQAVEKIEKNNPAAAVDQTSSPVEKTQSKLARFILIFSLVSFALAVISIGLFLKHREFFKKKVEEVNIEELKINE